MRLCSSPGATGRQPVRFLSNRVQPVFACLQQVPLEWEFLCAPARRLGMDTHDTNTISHDRALEPGEPAAVLRSMHSVRSSSSRSWAAYAWV